VGPLKAALQCHAVRSLYRSDPHYSEGITTRRATSKSAPTTGKARGSSPPAFIEPQLATLVDQAPDGDDWLHELKYDGYRILARLDAGKATLASRRANDWTAKFPTVQAAVQGLPVRNAVLDGEVAVPGADGRTSFQALQNALGRGASGAVYFVFDLLWLDGEDLTGVPVEQRKQRLAKLLAGKADKAPGKGGPLRYSDHVVGQGRAFFQQAQARGLEGIISKRMGEPYRRGRSTGWLKTKCITRQEFVIGGFTDPEGARSGIGALLVGTYDADGKLAFAGKVGTGFSQKTLAELHRKLVPLQQNSSPFAVTPPPGWIGRPAHWVRPELVGEVAFIEWTDDGRLRHPSFQGLREDKKPTSVVRERPAPTRVVAPDAAPAASKRSKVVRTAGKKAAAREGAAVLGERISNPDRVVYPEVPLTKLDVAKFYEAVAEAMLPHVQGRPLTLVRCPEGLPGGCFYMKHHSMGPVPAALDQIPIKEKTKVGKYLVVEDAQGLVALAQMGILEVHTWNSTRDKLEHPDRFILDLDPGPKVKWAEVVETARLIRERLQALQLESYVKTTGGKGLHVVVPVEPVLDWDRCLALSRAIAGLIEAERPRRYTLNLSKAGREDKILIDYLRNNRGSTAVAAFSTRAKPQATVSVPVAWDELSPRLNNEQFTVTSVPQRLARQKRDPWADFFRKPQKLPSEVLRLLR
jgi:bifunctional non-homologous end joining protein LigD